VLLRYKVEGGMDWCCRTHLTTPLEGTTWTQAIVVPSTFTDDEILELMTIPEHLQDVTELYIGAPATKEREPIDKEDKDERRRQYQRDRYWKRKAGV